MKKILLSLVVGFTVMFGAVSCDKNDQPTIFDFLQGQWVCVGQDGAYYATDSISVMYFMPDYTMYSAGPQTTGGSTVWTENTSMTYSLSGSTLTMKSGDVTTTGTINFLSYSQMLLTVKTITDADKTTTVNMQYIFQNASSGVVAETLPGLWSSTSALDSDNTDIWEFDVDGQGEKFNYYIWDNSEAKYLSSYTEGYDYYVYGPYVVLTEPNPTTASGTYTIWKVESLGYSTISWSTVLATGNTTSDILGSLGALPQASTTTIPTPVPTVQ